MEAHEVLVKMTAHKLLSLAIQDYWRNELEDESREEEALNFYHIVNEGSIIEFVDLICNKANSYAIQFVLEILRDQDNVEGQIFDEDFKDSVWLSIQNQLKADLVGWLE